MPRATEGKEDRVAKEVYLKVAGGSKVHVGEMDDDGVFTPKKGSEYLWVDDEKSIKIDDEVRRGRRVARPDRRTGRRDPRRSERWRSGSCTLRAPDPPTRS
jgi:hypothetical protein